MNNLVLDTCFTNKIGQVPRLKNKGDSVSPSNLLRLCPPYWVQPSHVGACLTVGQHHRTLGKQLLNINEIT